MLEEFHLIKTNGAKNIAYHYPSSNILEINDLVYNIIEQLQADMSIEELTEKHSISSDTIKDLLSKLSALQPLSHTQECMETDKSKTIDRITIHVSNDCNLRCSYCYAMGGAYAQKRKLMTNKTAADIVSFFTKRFDAIGHVVFFGGEPLLNVPVIATICKNFTRAAEEGKLKQNPTFGIITNGTILNSEIIDLIKKHISIVTVSVDGPKEVNDKNRHFPDGAGSFDKIHEFIKTVQSETSVELMYEATISSNHVEMDITEAMVEKYLRKEFALNGTIVPDMYEPQLYSKEILDESIIGNEIGQIYLSESFINLLSGLVQNNTREMCMVGKKIIAVSVDGEFYPCHINSGKSHLCLGSIYGENIFDDPKIYYDRFPFLSKLTKTEEPCTSCWGQRLCGGCAQRWFYNTEKDIFNNYPNPNLCKQTLVSIENIIQQVVQIKKDPQKWAALVAYSHKN